MSKKKNKIDKALDKMAEIDGPPRKRIADIMVKYDKDIEAAYKALPWELRCSAFPEFEILGDCVAFSNRGDTLTLDSARKVLQDLLTELTPTEDAPLEERKGDK